MNNEIKAIVDSLRIPAERERYLKKKDRLFFLERRMANMTFDRDIGMYARYLDGMDYLTKNYKDENSENTLKYLMYLNLREEYEKVLENYNYPILVNFTLRKELARYMELPNIYVEQSHFDHDKHIIDGTPLTPDKENDSIVIEPYYDMESLRDYRHFYNKVSFHYLEGLCQDYSFDLEGKQLGKVNIRKLVRK